MTLLLAINHNLLFANTFIKTAGPEGNPFYNNYWLAKEYVEHRIIPISPKHKPFIYRKTLVPIHYHDALQAHMHPLHKLGNANTIANYHEYCQTLIKNGTANGAASNTYLTTSCVPVKTKCINMKYRTGTLYNQKHAEWFKHSTSLTYPLCPQPYSALNILSGCQHTHIINMITERHNLACSMIFKAISKTGFLRSCFDCMDIGSSERLAMQNP